MRYVVLGDAVGSEQQDTKTKLDMSRGLGGHYYLARKRSETVEAKPGRLNGGKDLAGWPA